MVFLALCLQIVLRWFKAMPNLFMRQFQHASSERTWIAPDSLVGWVVGAPCEIGHSENCKNWPV